MVPGPSLRFDEQAGTFDGRAGLPEHVGHQVAQAVMELVQPKPNDMLVDLGAGTGQVGYDLAALPIRYIGMDISWPMLRVFIQRTVERDQSRPVQLLQADAERQWPLADRSVRVLFSSRTVHRLSPDHLVAETFRVAAAGRAALLVARIERDKHGVPEQMRRAMLELLEQHGRGGREGERYVRVVLDACCARGAVPVDPCTVTRWRVDHSPRQSIESWEKKSGLAGIAVPQSTKAEVLGRLTQWAISSFGSLDCVVSSEERYVLKGVWLQGS